MKKYKVFGIREGWRRASVTKKVAALVILVLSVFFAFVFCVLVVLVDKAYLNEREASLKSAVVTLEESYDGLEDEEAVMQCLMEVSQSSSSNVMVLNSDKNVVYSLSYKMTVTDQNGSSVVVNLDALERERQLPRLRLSQGDKVTVEYVSFNDERQNTYFPVRIEANGEIVTSGKAVAGEPERIKRIDGVISDISLPINNNDFLKFDAMRALFLWKENVPELDGGEYYGIINDPGLHSRCMVYVKSYKNGDIFFGALPLKHDWESGKHFRELFMPWAILSVILSLIVAMIFSRQITKPIKSIDRITAKMKNLDFSEKCELKSGDELGSLSENINEMSSKLDVTIKELTAANLKLKADIERDREAECRRKEFVAAISHELKTPLAIIRAYTEGLSDGVSPEKSARYMKVIIDETEKMDSLILAMLENSRLESGAEKIVAKRHDLVKLIRKTCKIFDESSEIEFYYDLPVGERFFEFDMEKIERVINNFMSNAIKHTKKNGNIYIMLEDTEKGCKFSVENEGDNICAEELDRVWDRFYKSDKSRERSDGSTGLGLSIAKNILKLHNAEYFAENTQRGVKFGFILFK